MRQSSANLFGAGQSPRRQEQANTRTFVLLLLSCLIGGVVAVVLFYRTAQRGSADANSDAGGKQLVVLSQMTKTILKRLDSPVEIRFYALLDPASVSVSVQAFAGRLDQLLSEFEREADGKIAVIRYNSRSEINAAAAAAAADGFKGFNLDKGDPCYFGLAVSRNERKESLPKLSPEWEQALEFDLARAIERVTWAKHPTTSLAIESPVDPTVIEEVKRTIPNFASVSVEEGTRMLRAAALKDFKAATAAMEMQVKEAEQRFGQAQNGGSETEQQAALKHLQQVQSEQTEKLKQIAARSSAQIEVLRQLKEAAR